MNKRYQRSYSVDASNRGWSNIHTGDFYKTALFATSRLLLPVSVVLKMTTTIAFPRMHYWRTSRSNRVNVKTLVHVVAKRSITSISVRL
jgi:hypothetical protein